MSMWAAALLAAAGTPAQAGQVYGGLGLPGVMLGYAHPLEDRRFTVRGDFAFMDLPSETAREEGIDYQAKAKLNRLGVFADWFVLGGGMRLTGGVTFNGMSLNLQAQGNGGTINIGGTDYVTSPDDRLDVKIEFPRTTPYLGIGYGHHQSTGLGFVFDLGASIGKAKLTATPSGPNLSQVDPADIDRELEELRDGVGKVKFFPQLSLGLTYRF